MSFTAAADFADLHQDLQADIRIGAFHRRKALGREGELRFPNH